MAGKAGSRLSIERAVRPIIRAMIATNSPNFGIWTPEKDVCRVMAVRSVGRDEAGSHGAGPVRIQKPGLMWGGRGASGSADSPSRPEPRAAAASSSGPRHSGSGDPLIEETVDGCNHAIAVAR